MKNMYENNEMQTQKYHQNRYLGSPANLKYHVDQSGVQGHWETQANRYIYHLLNGGELYWYPKDGSIDLLGAQEGDKQALATQLTCFATS